VETIGSGSVVLRGVVLVAVVSRYRGGGYGFEGRRVTVCWSKANVPGAVVLGAVVLGAAVRSDGKR